jgi:3-oxoacyl-[acyl-carrier-protein] synthase II
MHRVVITGIGALTPPGNTFHDAWDALMRGRSGIVKLDGPEFRGLAWEHGGRLAGYDLAAHASGQDVRRYDPFVLYAHAAAFMALADAGLGKAPALGGVVIGSSRGGICTLERAARSAGRASAFLMAGTTVSMAASYTARRFGMRGHVSGVSTACASGAMALAEAYTLVRTGRIPFALAGGAEAPLCPLCLRGYGSPGALSRSGTPRPFCRTRDGFVLGEGAVVLAMETLESAIARGAQIHGEVLGYGSSCDAGHPTAPDPTGQEAAVRAALKDAGRGPADVAVVAAHATGTQLGDRVEAGVIRAVYGEAVPPVIAAKGATGHMLAASGAMEAALALRALSTGTAPPAVGCADDEYSLGLGPSPRAVGAGIALVHSFGFGGVNVVLALGPDPAPVSATGSGPCAVGPNPPR